jgi:hypothetical protein
LSRTKADYTNIELQFPHDLFLKGEELYESKAVIDINKLDKSLYAFTIKEGVKIEVEWFKPLTKLQKATCECEFFKTGNMCRHSVAALLAYKAEFFKEKVEKVFDAEQAPKKSNVLNINAILNNLSKEDLKGFIKSYSGSDKKFAIAFKVHFARKVDLNDNELKYKSILDSILKPVTLGKNQYKASDIRSLINIVEEFHGQVDDAISLDELREAFILTKVSLNKLAYGYANGNYYPLELEKLIIENLSKLRDILLELDVNELRDDVFTFLLEMGRLSFTPFINSKENVFDILIAEGKKLDDLEEVLNTQLRKSDRSDEEIIIILSLKIRLLIKQGKPPLLDKSNLRYLDKIGEYLLKSKFDQELVLFQKESNYRSKDLALYYLQALTNLGSKKMINEAVELFIDLNDLRIIDFIKSRFDSKSVEDFVSLTNKKKTKLDQNPIFYMNFLVKSEQFKELLDYIASKYDLNFLIQHSQVLAKELPDDTSDLYETLVENYLNIHIGESSHKYIQDLFSHLNKLRLLKIINRLGLMIEMKFPDRQGLEKILN